MNSDFEQRLASLEETMALLLEAGWVRHLLAPERYPNPRAVLRQRRERRPAANTAAVR